MSNFLCCHQSADIDEKAIRKDKPEELVKALAEAKVYYCVYFIPTASCYCLQALRHGKRVAEMVLINHHCVSVLTGFV